MVNINIQNQPNNIQQLLFEIMRNGPLSKKELQQNTGFSWGFVSEKTNKLLEKKNIVSDVRQSKSVGRKTEELDINPNRNYILGVEISYRRIKIVVTDMRGRILEKETKEFEPEQREYEIVMSNLIDLMDNYYEKHKKNNIKGVGVALQGIVDREAGVSIRINRIKDWRNVPIKQIIEERYQVHVVVEHDSECLMKSEQYFGCLKNNASTEALLVSVSHAIGVATAIIINGQVYKGHSGRAGEIGKKVIGKDENGYMLLENHITREGIKKDYEQMFHEQKRFSEIENGALNGDEKCLKIFSQLTESVGIAVTEVCNILNPEIIVINTKECKCQEFIYTEISEVVSKLSTDEKVKVELSTLDDNAVAVGVSLVAIENEILKA